MKKGLVFGGNSGMGLAFVLSLLHRGYDVVYSFGLDICKEEIIPEKDRPLYRASVHQVVLDLTRCDYESLKEHFDADAIIISVGFGRVCPFESLTEIEIRKLINVNFACIAQILSVFYPRIASDSNFYTLIMGSIAGHVSSPLFSIYGASKSALCSLVQSLNAELKGANRANRILDVSPGSLKGTSFGGAQTDVSSLLLLAEACMDRMFSRETLFIPDFETYGKVLERFKADPVQFGLSSYNYKISSGRMNLKPQVKIGYLSGTFDLFHIGHLNLLRKAKEKCDYLIVGVHKSGAWKGKETFIPFEERLQIVAGISYVDKAEESVPEDSDAWAKYHYDCLFVGSDYKGSERFERYEAFFADKGVQIIYFDYTQGTSSTSLREALHHLNSKK